MKTKISSRDQLKIEIQRLTLEKQVKENQIKNHVKDYAQAMKPANLVKNAFSSLKGDDELKGMLKTKGIEAAIGFVVTQLVFKNSNPFVRTAATLLGTSFATGIFGEDSSKYIEKIKNIYHKFKAKHDKKGEGLFNEEDVYTG